MVECDTKNSQPVRHGYVICGGGHVRWQIYSLQSIVRAKVYDYRLVWIQQLTILPESVLQGVDTLTKAIKCVERRDRQFGV